MAEERKQSTRLRLWLWRSLAVVLILVFLMTRYLLRDQLTVRVAPVGHEVLQTTISTNGIVEPVADYPFYSPLATTVRQVDVRSGDVVPAGKLMIVLDDVDARAREATAESGVKSAQSALDAATHNGTQEQRQMAAAEVARARLERYQAQHDLDALMKLNSSGAASASEVNAARQRMQSADAGLQAAEQNANSRYSSTDVARAQAALADAEAGLKAAQYVVEKTAIRAPIKGTVYSVDAARGEFAEQGKLLLQMADLSRERVRAYFDEPDIGHLEAGQKIVIKWDAKQGREWHGHIERPPSTIVTYGTRHVGEVMVAIDDSDGTLLPETNVNVTVTTSSEPNVLSIAREALFSQNGQPYVFRVVGNNLVRTQVVTGIVNLTRAAVVSGLNDGDLVATSSTTGQPLQEGVPVKAIR